MRGDHVCVDRVVYSHHGIDVGANEVIHFSGSLGTKSGATIRRSTLADFARGGAVCNQEYGNRYTADETVKRAESRLGQSGYDLFANNCEHFARWCCAGQSSSGQVNGAITSAGLAAGSYAVAAGGVGLVAGAGGVAGLSGPGIMTGLATTGGLVGSGAVTGLAILGAAPGAVATAVMRRALCDSDTLTEAERRARRAGRAGAAGGALIGTIGTATVVSAAVTVTGLSAAGISSGLAAIGSIAGGGMAVGVGMMIAAPAILAGLLGCALYWLLRPPHGPRLNDGQFHQIVDVDSLSQSPRALESQ